MMNTHAVGFFGRNKHYDTNCHDLEEFLRERIAEEHANKEL